jgi:vancomycin resistance protein YoaR
MDEISVRLNKAESINDIMQDKGIKRVFAVARGIFVRKKQTVNPFLYCDESLLKNKLSELKTQIDRLPRDAYAIILQNDVVEKKPEVYGVEINIDKSLNTIKEELRNGNIGPISLRVGTAADYRLIRPRATMSDIDEINAVIGSAQTSITDYSSMNMLKLASKAINNVFIPKNDSAKTKRIPPEFSFYKFLQQEGYKMQKYNQGVNQVASTLYQALLDSDFEEKDIYKVIDNARGRIDSTQKQVKVIDKEIDFKFKNNNKYPMLIISNIKDSLVSVYILGKRNEVK